VKLFDVAAALAEIEGRPSASAPPPGATRATRATQAPGTAPRVAQVANVARPPAAKAETVPAPCRTSRTGRTPPALATAPLLDPEGLPFAACPACGNNTFWKPASLPFEGPGWLCETCNPPPADLWRHAVAVPVAGGTP
jgi:hypothetical protein